MLAKSINNIKLLWKNIKHVTYTNKDKTPNTELIKIKPSPIESVNSVNEYFAGIGKQLAQNIKHHNDDEYPSFLNKLPIEPQSFVLLDTDPDEVNCILMSLKTDSAPGWDNISTKYLKAVKNQVIPIIVHLANLCFQKGVFPSPLKRAVITPVHKSAVRDNMNIYRPISILPVISKILKKLLNNRLLNYFNKFDILSPS